MTTAKDYNFSLTFLLGFGLKQIPVPLMQFFLTYSMQTMHKKYPRVFEKFNDTNENSFFIVPTDLPFNFKLVLDPEYPSLTLIKEDSDHTASATIKASLANLLKMFEGNLDGDAAFFSKELIIEGSTAAIVTLRNAVDSEDIDVIKDLSGNIGLFSRVIKRLLRFGVTTYNSIDNSLLLLQDTLLKDFHSQASDHAKEIAKLKNELSTLRTNLLHKE